MKKLFVLFVFLLLAATPWAPTAAEKTDKQAATVSETAVSNASRLFEAYASAYSDETLEGKALVRKIGELEKEAEFYGLMEKKENNDTRRAIFSMKAAAAKAERDLIEMRLSKIAEKEACAGNGEQCNSAIAKWRVKNFRAQESFDEALNTIRMFVP